MASSAANGDALAALDEIRAPAGVVIPPKEIKGKISLYSCMMKKSLTRNVAILEKTAGYVARNGIVFEGSY
jgi:splicing factor 3A subunit 1